MKKKDKPGKKKPARRAQKRGGTSVRIANPAPGFSIRAAPQQARAKILGGLPVARRQPPPLPARAQIRRPAPGGGGWNPLLARDAGFSPRAVGILMRTQMAADKAQQAADAKKAEADAALKQAAQEKLDNAAYERAQEALYGLPKSKETLAWEREQKKLKKIEDEKAKIRTWESEVEIARLTGTKPPPHPNKAKGKAADKAKADKPKAKPKAKAADGKAKDKAKAKPKPATKGKGDKQMAAKASGKGKGGKGKAKPKAKPKKKRVQRTFHFDKVKRVTVVKNPSLPQGVATTMALVAGTVAGAAASMAASKIIEKGAITSNTGKFAALIGTGTAVALGLGMFSPLAAATAAVPLLTMGASMYTSQASGSVAGLVDMRTDPRAVGAILPVGAVIPALGSAEDMARAASGRSGSVARELAQRLG